MSGITGNPEHGVRIEVTLTAASTPERAVYEGHAHFPDRSVPLEAVATKEGVAVSVDGEHEALRKVAAALIRAATKSEMLAGEPVPRKIVRWREM